MSQIKYIKLEDLEPSDVNVRYSVDQEKLNELTESIRQLGILEPLLVKKHKKSYMIVFGNMRYLSAQKVGLASCPCIITQANDQEQFVIQLHENIKCLPLSHIDQATSFSHMRTKYNLRESEIAKLVGKSIAYISQHITILNSGDGILAALNKNQINFTVARELSHIKDPVNRQSYLNYAVESGASLDTIQQWVKELKRDEEFNPSEQPPDLGPGPIPDNEHPHSTCDCCSSPVKTANIHFLRVCPRCNIAIKDAVSAKNEETAP